MVLLGVLVLALAAVLTAGIATSNTGPVDAEAFGTSLEGLSVGGLFLLGVATGALALLGLVALVSGMASKRGKRRATKQQVREVRSERETLAEENARLQAELEERQRADRERVDVQAAERPSASRDDVAYEPYPTEGRQSAVREDVPAGDDSRGGRRGLFGR